MALLEFDEKGSTEPAPKPNKHNPDTVVRKAESTYQTVATEASTIDKAAIAYFMNGANVSLTYFQQLLKSGDEPQAESLSRDAVYQQYRRINSMVLKLEGGLQYNQDPTTSVMQVTGSGTILPAFAPNKNDMFLMDVGDGRQGVFTLTQCSASTIMRSTAYRVSFEMVSYYNKDYEEDQKRKTIETVNFDPNGWLAGCGPFVAPVEAAFLEGLSARLDDLINEYFDDFLSDDQNTLIIPDQVYRAYDSFVVDFLINLLNVTSSPRLLNLRQLNVSGDRRLTRSKTLWDALLYRRGHFLKTGITHAGLTDMRKLMGRPELRAIGYTGIPLIVVPIETQSNIDDRYHFEDIRPYQGYAYRPGQERRRDEVNISDPIESRPEYKGILNPVSQTTTPLIKPVTIDSGYVLSESFYNQSAPLSQLEIITRQAINKEELDIKIIERLVEKPQTWTDLERFYYYPILIYLLTLCIRRQHHAVN